MHYHFLNSFTRVLTIMYATIGISSENTKGRSFTTAIVENCLEDAVKCFENRKEQESIAYLRFWLQALRHDYQMSQSTEDTENTEDTRLKHDRCSHVKRWWIWQCSTYSGTARTACP